MLKKSIVFGVLAVLVIGLMGITSNALPPPFSKALELAKSIPVDENGNHVWEKTIAIDGEDIIYLIGYRESNDLLVMVKIIGPHGRAVGVYQGIFFAEVYAYGYLLGRVVLEEKDACELGFQFFRELVEHKLI